MKSRCTSCGEVLDEKWVECTLCGARYHIWCEPVCYCESGPEPSIGAVVEEAELAAQW